MSAALLTRMPWMLVVMRLLLAMLLLVLAFANAPRMLLLALLATALWFDLLDGMLARHLGVATPALRRADSRIDVLFFLAAAASIALLEPDIFAGLSPAILLLMACEAACQLVSYVRFGCSTATHTWLCKLWALLLFFSVSLILGKGISGWPVSLTIAIGLIAYAEVLLMLLLARKPPVDVPTLYHAWRASQEDAQRVLH